MAGHSHWAGIKRQKEATDKKRGVVFSKLLIAITAAAKHEPNPDFNPRLRTAVDKAKANKVPAENIERALKRASEASETVEDLVFEAYGPGGIALLIEATTDSRNRTVAEVKKILSDNGGKWADAGSVRWAFELAPSFAKALPAGRQVREGKPAGSDERWKAKFPQPVPDENAEALARLVEALENHTDVQSVATNAE